MNKNMRKRLIRIIAGIVLLLAAVLIDTTKDWINIQLFLASYLIVGGDILLRALKNILRERCLMKTFLCLLQQLVQ